MSFSTYIIDSILVLIVLMQIREKPLSVSQMVRPIVVVGAAVGLYLKSIPTAGNDLEFLLLLAIVGGVIGIASGFTLFMRRDAQGR